MSTETRQIARFIENHRSEPLIEGPDAPLVVFPSPLELTREQEDSFIQILLNKKDAIEAETGLGDAVSLPDAADRDYGSSRSFYGKRKLYDLTYQMETDWRASAIGGIFAEHNIHMPFLRRIVQQQISRAQNYFFMTEPYFAIEPQGRSDEDAARHLDRYCKWKAKQARLIGALMKAIERAFVLGECVLKSSWRRDDDFFETVAEVAIDPATGEPLVAADGDYIFESDQFVGIADESGGIVQNEKKPVKVLKRDGVTEMPEDLQFERRKIRRLETQFEGAELESVYYTDILVPLNAKDIQSADCVCHVYEMPAIDLAQSYMKRGVDPDAHPKFVDLLRDIAGGGGEVSTGRLLPRESEGETDRAESSSLEPICKIGEFYARVDVNGDGIMEHVVAIVDLESKRPIYYDYVSNFTPDGKRPFHVVRVNPVDGRWHGKSQAALFYGLQFFQDLLSARWDRSQSSAGRVDVVNPSIVEEGDDGEDIEINGGETFHVKATKDPKDFLTSIYLSDVKSGDLQRQIEYVQQVMQALGGVANANDNAMAGLDTTKLATGVRNIEKSGQELFAPLLTHLEDGLSDGIRGFLVTTIHHMPEGEVYEFFEGEVRNLQDIRPADINGIDFLVSMEMTRYKGEQELVQSERAIGLIERFFAMHPFVQTVAARAFKQQAKLIGMRDADSIFVPGRFSTMMSTAPSGPGGERLTGDSMPGRSDYNL